MTLGAKFEDLLELATDKFKVLLLESVQFWYISEF